MTEFFSNGLTVCRKYSELNVFYFSNPFTIPNLLFVFAWSEVRLNGEK